MRTLSFLDQGERRKVYLCLCVETCKEREKERERETLLNMHATSVIMNMNLQPPVYVDVHSICVYYRWF